MNLKLTQVWFWVYAWQYRRYKRKISKKHIEIAMEHGRKHLFATVDAELASVSIYKFEPFINCDASSVDDPLYFAEPHEVRGCRIRMILRGRVLT